MLYCLRRPAAMQPTGKKTHHAGALLAQVVGRGVNVGTVQSKPAALGEEVNVPIAERPSDLAELVGKASSPEVRAGQGSRGAGEQGSRSRGSREKGEVRIHSLHVVSSP